MREGALGVLPYAQARVVVEKTVADDPDRDVVTVGIGLAAMRLGAIHPF